MRPTLSKEHILALDQERLQDALEQDYQRGQLESGQEYQIRITRLANLIAPEYNNSFLASLGRGYEGDTTFRRKAEDLLDKFLQDKGDRELKPNEISTLYGAIRTVEEIVKITGTKIVSGTLQNHAARLKEQYSSQLEEFLG